MPDDATTLGMLAADCDLLAYDPTVAVEDRLILINLANDLREAQFAKMSPAPYPLADVLTEGPNTSRKPATAATLFLAAFACSVAVVLMLFGAVHLYSLLTH